MTWIRGGKVTGRGFTIRYDEHAKNQEQTIVLAPVAFIYNIPLEIVHKVTQDYVKNISKIYNNLWSVVLNHLALFLNYSQKIILTWVVFASEAEKV